MNSKNFKLSDLISENGVYVDGDWIESKDQDPNGNVRLIQLADIGDGNFLNKSARYMNFEDAKRLNCTFLEKDDILIARMPDPLGRACIFPGIGQLAVTVVDICIVRPASEKVDVTYLKFLINNQKFRREIVSYTTGTTRKRISRTNLDKITFPLPPLPEQIAIANILSKAEALIAKRKESLALLDVYLKSTFLEMFGDPVRNDKGWESSSIKNECFVKGGKRVPKGMSLVRENTGYPYIKAGNIKKGKITSIDLEYLPPEIYKKLKHYRVSHGDVCITVVGANIGDIGIVPKELDGANLTENANKLLIKNNSRLNNVYLANYLELDFIQESFFSRIRAAGVPKLAIFRIEEINLILPPLELQNQFAAVVEKVEALKEKYQNSLGELENLYGSLSQRAFRGELANEG